MDLRNNLRMSSIATGSRMTGNAALRLGILCQTVHPTRDARRLLRSSLVVHIPCVLQFAFRQVSEEARFLSSRREKSARQSTITKSPQLHALRTVQRFFQISFNTIFFNCLLAKYISYDVGQHFQRVRFLKSSTLNMLSWSCYGLNFSHSDEVSIIFLWRRIFFRFSIQRRFFLRTLFGVSDIFEIFQRISLRAYQDKMFVSYMKIDKVTLACSTAIERTQ